MPEPTYRIAQRLLARRAEVGVKKYGQHLSAASPGCMIIHALEEAADQVNYLIAEVQRRREALELLIPLRDVLKIVGDYGFADTITTVIDILGGEAALAKYDEILGTVAEDATVAPDPRDEALRVAEEALEYCCKEFWGISMSEANDSWLAQVAGRAEDKAKRALAAIRGAR